VQPQVLHLLSGILIVPFQSGGNTITRPRALSIIPHNVTQNMLPGLIRMHKASNTTRHLAMTLRRAEAEDALVEMYKQ
jgi:hypothetical protein